MKTAALPILMLSLGACASPATELSVHRDEYNLEFCRCAETVGFASRSDCLAFAEESAWSDAEVACMDEVYASESAAEAPRTCALTASRVALDCLQAVVGCDGTALGMCTNQRESALDACPELSAGVVASLIACTP